MATMQGINNKKAELPFELNKMSVKKLPIKNLISKELVFAITDPDFRIINSKSGIYIFRYSWGVLFS
jgi:hypothetical protein